MFENYREDLRRYFQAEGQGSRLSAVARVATSYGVYALAAFRFGKWTRELPQPMRALGSSAYFVLYKLVEMATGIRISAESELGPGTYIHNFGGTIIHGKLGRGCTIAQGAQLLSRSDGKNGGWPVLGSEVFVGAGAKILGAVVVGDRAKIGANAVVVSSVPPGATAVGVPARIINRHNDIEAAARHVLFALTNQEAKSA